MEAYVLYGRQFVSATGRFIHGKKSDPIIMIYESWKL